MNRYYSAYKQNSLNFEIHNNKNVNLIKITHPFI